MSTPIKSLFSISNTPTTTQIAADSKNEQETYRHYGTRICGIVTASSNSLAPYLQQIYNSERRSQANDRNLQEQKRNELQTKLNDINSNIQSERSSISRIETSKVASEEKIAELREQLNEAKAKDGEVNKMAKTKMCIGLVILAILTVYLFIFYSSTFYTAFLFQPSDDNIDSINIGTAMFNSRALSDAWAHGIGEFLFIVTAPIIFLGLGYALHFFMVQKSFTKWFKVILLFGVTLAFDCILAYKIGDMIHGLNSMMTLAETEPYSFKMAIADINSWAVVFCGFIVYVIWGIVFDMVMTAYENLRSNKHEIKSIQDQITSQKQNLASLNDKLCQHQTNIAALQAKHDTLMNRMANNIFINEHLIKSCLSDFFAGWISLMPALSCSQSQQEDAQRIYDTTITTLFPA